MLKLKSFALHRTVKRFYTSLEAECTLSHLDGRLLGTSVISFNRPKARNALGKQMITEFSNCLDQVRTNKSRVLIIKSEVQGVFCSGADLKERAGMTPSESEAFVNKLRKLFSEVENLPLPTIACIGGFALGGGLELALACDLRVAEKEVSLLGLTETSLAIIPGAGGTQRLPRLIGIPKAKELIYTARRILAEEAEKIGLINYATPKGEAYEKCLHLALEILPNVRSEILTIGSCISYAH
jgi:methylglutaconyl-CoA hydratase